MSFVQDILLSKNEIAIDFFLSECRDKLKPFEQELSNSLCKISDKITMSEILMIIIRKGKNELLEMIIEKDIVKDIIKKDSTYLECAFNWCTSRGHVECIKLLIKAGAKIELDNNLHFYIARCVAKSFGHKVEPIKNKEKVPEHNCKISKSTESVINMLCKLICENDETGFNTLISLVNVNDVDRYNSTMLMHAAQHGISSIVRNLLKKGASVAMSGGSVVTNKSALKFAVCDNSCEGIVFWYGNFKCIKLLLNAGSDIEILNSDPHKYFLIKLVKEILDEKKKYLQILQSVQNIQPEPLSIKESSYEKKESVQPEPLLIKLLNEHLQPYKKIQKLVGDYNKVRLLNDTYFIESSISSENMTIEMCSHELNYLLPIGTIVNGKKINEPIACIFVNIHTEIEQ